MKLHLLHPGSIGTPDFQAIFNALVMQAQATSLQRAIVLKASPETAASSAAVVKAAAVGTFTKTVILTFQDADGNVHTWINGSPVTLTPVEVAVDAQIGVPTLDDTTPLFTDGVAQVVVTYDTDANATKTYAAGDVIGFTAACATILGIAPTETNADFTDTMVA
jgi:hypothetical protein